MFRNALRQSTRAVGAVSAAGRVAAVSQPQPSVNLPIPDPTSIPSKNIGTRFRNTQLGPLELFWRRGTRVGVAEELFIELPWGACVAVLGGGAHNIFGLRLTCFFPPSDPKCRTRRLQRHVDADSLIRRRQGIPD
ncbi:hypothetical protein LZ32DRAFT_57160 [Colletotrichum eremochloae]|nr:hypothetical protein LZ32DRAFT_57160 [Colletotrichum eremochloae]